MADKKVTEQPPFKSGGVIKPDPAGKIIGIHQDSVIMEVDQSVIDMMAGVMMPKSMGLSNIDDLFKSKDKLSDLLDKAMTVGVDHGLGDKTVVGLLNQTESNVLNGIPEVKIKLKCYWNSSFTGHYPVGTAAIVWAESQEEAALLLAKELDDKKIPQKLPIRPEDMKEFNPLMGRVMIINDGNY